MKRLFLLLLILTFSSSNYAQSLGWTKDEIEIEMQNTGKEYELKKTEGGIEYISYWSKVIDVNSATYNIESAYIFDSTETCYLIKNIYPIEAINSMIKILEKNYVKIEDLKYRDYNTDLILEIKKYPKYSVFVYMMYFDK